MVKIFNSDFKITQGFGEDFIWTADTPLGKKGKWTYKSMGLKGHNGIDLIPTSNDWSLFNTIPGYIMILKFDGGYGNRIAIWDKARNKTEYFNHLSEFFSGLKLGQFINAGTYIGKMGNTGLGTGAHLHYALADTDNQANRINRDNGYGGYYNPLMYLRTGVI